MRVMTALLRPTPRAGVVRQNQLQSLPFTNTTTALHYSIPRVGITRQHQLQPIQEISAFLLLNTMHGRR
jgi:hypothetical protein